MEGTDTNVFITPLPDIPSTIPSAIIDDNTHTTKILTSFFLSNDSAQIDRQHILFRHPRFRIFQSYVLLWIDSDIDQFDYDIRNSLMYFQSIADSFKTFSNPDQCLDFITDIVDEKVIMIISNALEQQLILLTQDIDQLDSIYMLDRHQFKQEPSVKEFEKVKGVFTEIELLSEAVRKRMHQLDSSAIPISIITPSSSTNLDELDQSFMYSQLLKEILLDMPHDDDAKKEFVEFCRIQYAGNDSQIRILNEFEEQYAHPSPIWWYTRECFTYWMLNKALRTQDTEVLIKMGFFLRDLHMQIEQLHLEANNRCDMTVFRGQGMVQAEFEKLTRSKGGLLSFNSFLSTSTNYQVGDLYANSAKQNCDLIGILFRIEIDPKISSTPFAAIGNVSYYEAAENEILFSMHTVFRIGEIEEIQDRLWEINLTLTADNDQLLKRLTDHWREKLAAGIATYRIAELMICMGRYNKAEEILEALLNTTTDDNQQQLAELNHQLGFVKCKKGDLANALAFYEKALDIEQKFLSSDHPDLAPTYNNIGSVCNSLGKYTTALSYYEKALEIYQKSLPSTHLELATTYSNIATVHQLMGEYSKALSYYEKTLEIHEKSLPPNHPNLAIIYSNIASVAQLMKDYLKALSYLQKTLEIYRKSVPPDHPDVGFAYSSIGAVFNSLREHSTALSYFEKTLEIYQKSLPPTHPDLAIAYNNMGSVYNSLGKYSTGLSYLEKTLEIQQKYFPPVHPYLATTYFNIATVHQLMGEKSKALSYYEKTLEIRQKSLPLNHPDLATIYSHIESMHKSDF